MTGTDGEIVYQRDLSSGRVHKLVRAGDRFVPYGGEQDNLDDAGESERITAVPLPSVLPGVNPDWVLFGVAVLCVGVGVLVWSLMGDE